MARDTHDDTVSLYPNDYGFDYYRTTLFAVR